MSRCAVGCVIDHDDDDENDDDEANDSGEADVKELFKIDRYIYKFILVRGTMLFEADRREGERESVCVSPKLIKRDLFD